MTQKATSELAARRLFPEIDFKRNERCRVSDDNKIDALLLCEYCKRNFCNMAKFKCIELGCDNYNKGNNAFNREMGLL